MAIKEFENARTGDSEYIASGIVEAVYYNPLKTIKTYANDWTPTHSMNIVVDGDKIGLGLTDRDGVGSKQGVKDKGGKFHDLAVGLEIRIPVTVGDYNGKPQYGGRASEVVVTNSEGVAKAGSEAPKQAYKAQKRDMSGMATGHGINVAMNVLGDVEDPDAIINAAKEAHDLTTKLKVEYAEKNPDMSDYDLGAMVGQSILSASHYVENVADIEAIARQTLDVVVPQVSEYVKGKQEPEQKEAKKPVAKKVPAKKTAAKKTTKGEATPERVDDSDIPESAFGDMDSIPF